MTNTLLDHTNEHDKMLISVNFVEVTHTYLF